MEEKINELLTRGVTNVIDGNHLKLALKSEKKLRIKLGIDPTGPKLHLGRAITLWKLKAFQDLGHQIVFIVGDFTAQIGDASDKMAERQILTLDKIKENFKTYKEQIGKILDLKKVEFRYNGEWHFKLTQQEMLEMAMQFTVAQMIERENFIDRFKAQKPIGLHEILYPLLQGYDSVAVKADVELGGNDQLFNLLAGRTVQKKYGQKPQDVMTFELLEGTDGRKMSTSYENCIYIEDSPNDMYGKVMSILDTLLIKYFTLVTDVPLSEIKKYEEDLKSGTNPRDIKAKLAFHVVKRYYGEEKARVASEEFDRVFKLKELPSEMTEFQYVPNRKIIDVAASVFLISKSEARRLINQGAVKQNDKIVKEIDAEIEEGILKVGKRGYLRITTKK